MGKEKTRTQKQKGSKKEEMTCKDCIHYEVCLEEAKSKNESLNDFDIEGIEDFCRFSKPKSRYIELPCAVGDKVYWINRLTKEIETDIVGSIHQYEDGFSITTDTIGNKCTSTYSLDRFLKIMHFTKEEAEKALENKQ